MYRSPEPVFEPKEKDYEKFGYVENVVFTCGVVEKNDQFYVYYGASDQVIGLATIGVGSVWHSCDLSLRYNVDLLTFMKNLDKHLTNRTRAIRVIYVSSYIPRYCGIATFTKDLTNAVNLLNPYALAEIMVLNLDIDKLEYPWEVKYKIEQNNLATYLQAAEYINQSGADIVCLEHEFGIFGGRNGEYVLPFIDALHIPLVTTLHTVVSDSTSRDAIILKRIINKSVAVTVMLNKVKEKLVNDYRVAGEKIVTIPHGTPDLPYSPTTPYKKRDISLTASF